MALHLRDQIMDALATLLTGLTTTGSRVYVDRDADSEPLSAAELPGITIQQVDESVQALTLGQPRHLERYLNVQIDAFVKLTTSTLARKQLNLIDKEIQTAIAGSLSLGGVCKYVTATQVDFSTAGDTDKPQSRARMNYQVFYMFTETTPDTAA